MAGRPFNLVPLMGTLRGYSSFNIRTHYVQFYIQTHYVLRLPFISPSDGNTGGTQRLFFIQYMDTLCS